MAFCSIFPFFNVYQHWDTRNIRGDMLEKDEKHLSRSVKFEQKWEKYC